MADKKVAVITGAGSGVGKAVAQALLAAGFHVVLAGRRAELLEQVKTEAQTQHGLGEHVHCVPTDVSDPEA
ncbi:MAG: SDR family NAD(P)-dependent oxidoreductase, partial [Comamonas sp.]